MLYVSRLSGALAVLCLWGTPVQAELVDRSKFTSDDVYALHVKRADFRLCDANRDGAFQPSELSCYDRLRAQDALPPPTQFVQTSPDTAVAIQEALQADEPLRNQPCVNDFGILVRRSKPDVGSLADPVCTAEAIGAEFAFANNGITDNEVWSARGLVAMPIVFEDTLEKTIPYLKSVSLSPYVSFDRVSNTDNLRQNIDDLGYGGLLEFGVPNVLGATQNIDIDAGLVSSFAGTMKNWAVNVSWEPHGDTNRTLLGGFGKDLDAGRYFTARLSPTLQTALANELGDLAGQPLFTDNDWALRTGPTVTFAIDGAKRDGVPAWVQRLHYEITYGWLYDWLSGRDYALLDTALSFGLDKTGHLGLTLSYRNGELESTGQPVDLSNIALSVSY